MQHIIGLDIGGANLKAAHSDGPCRSRSFPVWKEPQRLAAELRELIADWLPCKGMAVTMTAELADCYETKADGVDRVLKAVEEAADGIPIAVWQSVGEFVSPEIAREFPILTAAANWHALATFIGRMVPDGNSLLVDIGSTTTDIIPIENGTPIPTGRSDGERLNSGELVYSGVRRTPLCAIAYSVPLKGDYTQVAAELFATTLDVYLLTGQVEENPTDCDTANGRPATVTAAHDRLARLLCRDRMELSLEEARAVAAFLADVQRQRITGAVDRVLSTMQTPCNSVLISGSGSFLAESIVGSHRTLRETEQHNLREIFTAETSESACAYALARMGAEGPATFE